MANPTVLVKKKDGTFVRVPLRELSWLLGTFNSSAKAAPKNLKPVAVAPQVTSLESKSFAEPLSEKLDSKQGNAPLVSGSRKNQVNKVLQELEFNVPSDYQNRLRTVIQLCLKDIRSPQATEQFVRQPVQNGGLGLNPEQAAQLAAACVKFGDHITSPKNQVLAKKTATLPSKSSPVHLISDTLVSDTLAKKPLEQLDTPQPPPQQAGGFKLQTARPTKQVMHDVQDTPSTYSPVDELNYITLQDFRRLSSDPKEAARRLKQKFLNLRSDSILLYLSGKNAWHQSPLYSDYARAISKSIAEGQKLINILDDKQNIQVNEIEALAEMSKSV